MDSKYAAELEIAEAQYLLSRVEALIKVPGNPYGASTIKSGNYISFFVVSNPSPMNSRICGINFDTSVLPKKIVAAFKKVDIVVNIPVIGKPKDIKKKEGKIELNPLRGWSHGQFVAEMDLIPDAPVKHTTRTLKIKDVVDFVEIHSKEFGTPKSAKDMTLDMYKGLFQTHRVEAYAIDIDDQPAAIGLTYYANNKIAYLATAATSKIARKKGAHQALIAQRIKAARKRGSRLVFSTALLNSQSRRNLERAGLALSHVQTIVTI